MKNNAQAIREWENTLSKKINTAANQATLLGLSIEVLKHKYVAQNPKAQRRLNFILKRRQEELQRGDIYAFDKRRRKNK